MRKVIAVIDEPETCFSCPFCLHGFHIKCKLSDKYMDSFSYKDTSPEWCELKEIPEQRNDTDWYNLPETTKRYFEGAAEFAKYIVENYQVINVTEAEVEEILIDFCNEHGFIVTKKTNK